MIETVGGRTIARGKGGFDTDTLYLNGSKVELTMLIQDLSDESTLTTIMASLGGLMCEISTQILKILGKLTQARHVSLGEIGRVEHWRGALDLGSLFP